MSYEASEGFLNYIFSGFFFYLVSDSMEKFLLTFQQDAVKLGCQVLKLNKKISLNNLNYSSLQLQGPLYSPGQTNCGCHGSNWVTS